jgi:HPt (histidine-containing phosphotransfer) domain-containing protein
MLAAVAVSLVVAVLGAVQASSAIALRASAQRGAWPTFVPGDIAAVVERLGPSVPLPSVLRLVLARQALARGDFATADVDLGLLAPSRDRLALAGGLADARGDASGALRAYLADVERAVETLEARGRIAEALALQEDLVRRLAADPTQIDALAQADFDLGRLQETQAYQFGVGTAVRHAHELAGAAAYAHAVDLAPFEERYLIAFANQEINLRDFKAAGRAFERARDADPTSVEPVAGLGAVALADGDVAFARACLERARTLDPASAATHRLANALGE